MKNHHFYQFSFFELKEAKLMKMMIFLFFSWFFKICFNHQKSSSTVCAILLKVPRSLFRPPNTFFDTSGPIIVQIVRGSQKPKIMKNANFDENSIFHTLAKIAQNDVIWQEMDTWGVLDAFCTRNWYQNSFRSYFKVFWNFGFFFEFFICGSTQNRTRRNFYGSVNFEIILKIT